MARLVITTIGSSGDLHPFIALGLALRERGHAVVFAVQEAFARHARAEGFEICLLSGDAQTLAPHMREMLTSSNPLSSMRVISRHFLAPSLAENIELLRDLCADADMLIASTGQVAASAVAELTGVRWLTVALSPTIPSAWIAPTREAARVPGAPGRLLNRALWTVSGVAIERISDSPLNAVRARYGLPPRRRLLQDGNLSPTFTAVAVSPSFCPRPPDWPVNVHTTGFLLWDTPADWSAPPALDDFLRGERPVVAISSGSMGAETGDFFASFFAASVAAVHDAGARALVIGAGGAFAADGPETLQVDYAPFSLVYPRCAAVIHHGGAGTLAQSLRAGVPSLLVPWGFDQFFHGVLVEQAGVGLTLARKRFTTERARAALTTLLYAPPFRERARALASQIAQEDGVGTLRGAIEASLAQQPARAPVAFKRTGE
ncbi:MAG TPA: glycosyltransferase [Ktedonobacterales bacterium]|nr:glycosyltransferase [Ktedonobacterales bacterium]